MLASLLALGLVAPQPEVTKTTPGEVLQIVRFNAACTDELLMHQVVELRGEATEIYRDGIGGYVVRFDASFRDLDRQGRIEIHCHFAGGARRELAGIEPGKLVTLRGVPRQIKDHLHWPTDASVWVTVKDCALVAAE
jgi:hypothetical protein